MAWKRWELILLLIHIKNSIRRYEYINILHIYMSKYKQFYKYKLMTSSIYILAAV